MRQNRGMNIPTIPCTMKKQPISLAQMNNTRLPIRVSGLDCCLSLSPNDFVLSSLFANIQRGQGKVDSEKR